MQARMWIMTIKMQMTGTLTRVTRDSRGQVFPSMIARGRKDRRRIWLLAGTHCRYAQKSCSRPLRACALLQGPQARPRAHYAAQADIGKLIELLLRVTPRQLRDVTCHIDSCLHWRPTNEIWSTKPVNHHIAK
jgi:hypothetical protein